MKFDKKIIIIIAAVVALAVIASVASLVACGNGNNPENGETESTINVPGESGNENESDEGNKNTGELTFTDCTPKDIYILHVNGALNLRKAPDYTAESVKVSVNNGTKLSKIAVSNNGEWFKVMYNNEVCYVVAKYTTELADLDAGFVAVEKTLVSKGSLKIRIEPIINDKEAIGFYAEGDEITVVMENTAEGWYKVKFVNVNKDETFGYIKSGKDNFVGNKEETSSESVESTEATENENKEPAEAGK
jgi:hypothetical protein